MLNIDKRKPLVSVSTRIDEQLKLQAEQLAKKEQVSESEIYRYIITYFFDNVVNDIDTK